MKIGIAADHAGFQLKEELRRRIEASGHGVHDFGATSLQADDDYPDYVIPLAEAIGAHQLPRGLAICGSGVGACVTANKIVGVRASICHDTYSARQIVEHDDLNVLVLGSRVVGSALAWELVRSFLTAEFTGDPRHVRRLAMIAKLESHLRR